MTSSLPADIHHLIHIQLCHQKDFLTLFHCALAARFLTASALANLYRMQHAAPVTSLGHEETDLDENRDALTAKWASLWRSLILSTLGKTAYPYCRYVRVLDLEDLQELLENARFRDSFAADFFAGDLAPFLAQIDTGSRGRPTRSTTKRLDIPAIVARIGDQLTQHTPLVEELKARTVRSESVRPWVPRLTHLQQLGLFDGSAFAGVGSALAESCPSFRSLRMFFWRSEDTDSQGATLFADLRPASLVSLEIYGTTSMGELAALALARHATSLRKLKLGAIPRSFLLALPGTTPLSQLTELSLESASNELNMPPLTPEACIPIASWLQCCSKLKQLTIEYGVSTSSILPPLLSDSSIRLEKLSVSNYLSEEIQADALHDALATQTELQSLNLNAEESCLNFDKLVFAVCQLDKLTELYLPGVSDRMDARAVRQIALALPELRELTISGYNLDDSVWADLVRLRNLRMLVINAYMMTTAAALLRYVRGLDPVSNAGLALTMTMADPFSALTEDEQARVQDALARQVGGRFEYSTARDRDEAMSSSSDEAYLSL